MRPNENVLGRLIAGRRKAAGLSQRQAAKLCDVHHVTWWRWEGGRQLPIDVEQVEYVLDTLDARIATIVALKGSRATHRRQAATCIEPA